MLIFSEFLFLNNFLNVFIFFGVDIINIFCIFVNIRIDIG